MLLEKILEISLEVIRIVILMIIIISNTIFDKIINSTFVKVVIFPIDCKKAKRKIINKILLYRLKRRIIKNEDCFEKKLYNKLLKNKNLNSKDIEYINNNL